MLLMGWKGEHYGGKQREIMSNNRKGEKHWNDVKIVLFKKNMFHKYMTTVFDVLSLTDMLTWI